MKQFFLYVALLLSAPLGGAETEELNLTLDDAISRARVNSVDAAVALNELKTAYWEYRSYRAELLPEVNFSATIPGYHRQYAPYMNDNGSYSFVRNNYLQMNGEVSLSQNIWLTGGKVSVNTSLDFYRQLDGDKYNRFMSIPVALTLSQPIFGVNNLKWDRKIEPVRYKEAKASYLSASENVAIKTISYFFQLLMADENKIIASQNLENAQKLYNVAKEKREMGRISGNDLLQMELNLLNAESELTSCESDRKSCMFQLRTLLDLNENTDIIPVPPTAVPTADITYEDALQKALERNKFAANLRRRQLEADYEVAKAKGNLRQISLFAQIGYTGTDRNFAGAYSPLKDNQVVEIGFEIPILDWGRRRGKVKVAESNRKVTESRLRQERADFAQNIFILVERYRNQMRQLEISRRADEIAARRYSTNVETFMIGKISTLDLNDSRVSKDEARREYINELYSFWNYYYQIRSLTLWDYARAKDIDADFEKDILRK
ncbi:MAG: TolC family protein [Muribaculaceae bacterium]|nr:TolC family protein [Muribaculaceae bacterium]